MQRASFGALACALAFAATSAATAASLQVTPTLVELLPTGNATSITIRNGGDALAVAQIRIVKWLQKDGQDVLEPAQDIVASPPAARIQPGVEQIIRIVKANKPGDAIEGSYRILVDEIPANTTTEGYAVTLRTQYSVPLFVQVPRATRPALAWQIEPDGAFLKLTATNAGDRRAKLLDLQLARPDGEKVHVTQGLSGYVLARSSRHWLIDPKVTLEDGEKLTVSAELEQGPVSAVITVDARK